MLLYSSSSISFTFKQYDWKTQKPILLFNLQADSELQ